MTTVSSVSYTGNVYPAAKTATTTYYRSLSPSFYLYHQIKFDENNTVDWSANYSFSKNKSRNNYVEGSFDPIINNADEKYHTLGAVIDYIVTFANGGTLGLNISNYFNKSSSEYSGTSPSMQDMSVNEFLVHLGYRHRFGEKFSLGVRVGVDVSTSKINGRQRVTRYYGRPGIDGSYKIDNTSSLSFRAYMGSYVPSLSTKNEAEVRLSQYEVRRGNPDLKDGKPITGGISYSKYWKKFSLSAYVDYNATLDNTVAYYTVENNTLINTYLTSGTYNNVLVGASGVFRLFDNSLQLRLTAGFRHTDISGIYDARLNRAVFSSSLFYSVGGFSFSGYYTAPGKSLATSPSFSKSKGSYGMTASWGHRGLFLQVGCQNIFNGKMDYNRSYFDYGLYSYEAKSYSRWLGSMLFVSLSYSFDFGRKIKRENVNINTDGQSGILK